MFLARATPAYGLTARRTKLGSTDRRLARGCGASTMGPLPSEEKVFMGRDPLWLRTMWIEGRSNGWSSGVATTGDPCHDDAPESVRDSLVLKPGDDSSGSSLE
jgi:hypothetical protein